MFDAAHDEALPAQTPSDPMIEVAERHLRLLAEVAELAMDAARASSALVVATAEAAAKLVAEKDGAWACEADKAYAVRGSREAADAFTRVTRALRLTLTLETATAERLRDLRAGIVPARDDRAERGAARPGAALDLSREKVRERVADAIAEAAADDGDIAPALDLARDLRERFTETDRFGPLLNRPLIEVVGLICADIGVSPDWSRWNDDGFPPETRTPRYAPPPPSWGGSRMRPTVWPRARRRGPQPRRTRPALTRPTRIGGNDPTHRRTIPEPAVNPWADPPSSIHRPRLR